MSREYSVTRTSPVRRRFMPRWVLAAAMQVSLVAGAVLGVAGMAQAATSIVILGDSLVAGYGMSIEEAFPARLESALKARGYDVTIANAGVSGDTSAAGLARLDWSVPEGTDAVVVELGANDALRGLPPEQTEKNLDAIVSRLKQRGIAVLVAGMIAPPNMGAEYGSRFNPIFARIAERYGATLYPFFLEGVAGQPALNQSDGIHPTPAGIEIMVGNFLPTMELFLKQGVTAPAN